MTRARDLADSADKDITGTLTVDAIDVQGTVTADGLTVDGTSQFNTGRTFVTGGDEPYIFGVGRNGNTNSYYLGVHSSTTPDLIFSNNAGTENVRFTYGGNVGIGTSSPSGKIEVSSSGDPDIYFSNIGSTAGNRSVNIRYNFSDGVGYRTEAFRATGNANTDVYLRFVKGSGSEVMRLDASGRVGINRVPSISNSKLEVGGADNVPLINVEASGNTGGIGIGSGGLQLFHGSSSKVTITSGGNVGIATASPGAKLQVGGNAKLGSASQTTFSGSLTTGGLDVMVGSGAQSAGAFQVWDDNELTTPRFTVTREGNVGIGTGSPTYKTEISDGTVTFGVNPLSAYSTVYVGTTSNHNMNFITNGNSRLNITSGGNVGIGTDSPQEQIHSAAGGSNALRVSGGANNNKKVEIGYDNTNGPYIKAGSSGVTGLQFYVDNTSLAATIDSSGNVGIGTTPISGGANGRWLTLNGTTYSGGVVYSVSGTAKGYTYWDNGGELRLQSSTGIEFLANNTVAAAIKSNGVVAQKGDYGWESKILISGDGYSPYIQVKTNIRRNTNVMYYAHIIGHKSYDGSRVNTILTGYAYANYIGYQNSTYHGYTNLGTYGIQDVYYSSDDYMCFTIDSGYSAYSITLGTNMNGYSLSTQPDILSYTNQSSTTRYY